MPLWPLCCESEAILSKMFRPGYPGWSVHMDKFSYRDLGIRARGPFLENPENFSGPQSHGEISHLTITELFYSHILNMKRGSLHTRSFRRIHFSVVRHRRTKNGFTGPKSFRGFRETSPSSASHANTSKF